MLLNKEMIVPVLALNDNSVMIFSILDTKTI